jgi:LemA protein
MDDPFHASTNDPLRGFERIGPRRRSPVAWLALGAVAALPALVALWVHNGLVARREGVAAAWAQIESQYQRRADLVPELVLLLKRQLRHERETLTAVVEARGEALAERAEALEAAHGASRRELAALGGPAPADGGRLAAVASADVAMAHELHRVFALAESYPELRSADHFLGLQAQLEGTENRINVARLAFNDAVRDYNAALEKLPGRWISQACGYSRHAYFEVDPATRHAPVLALD